MKDIAKEIKKELLDKGCTEEQFTRFGMRPVVGFEEDYSVTSCGRVWSHRRGKFMSASVSSDGYYRVSLKTREGKVKTIDIHRLVALAYIPNPLGLREVNHKTEIKSKNYVNGLEWCTRKYNMNYGTVIERAKATRDANGTRTKPTRFIAGMTVQEVSELTGKPVQTIYWQLHQGWQPDRILNNKKTITELRDASNGVSFSV